MKPVDFITSKLCCPYCFHSDSARIEGLTPVRGEKICFSCDNIYYFKLLQMSTLKGRPIWSISKILPGCEVFLPCIDSLYELYRLPVGTLLYESGFNGGGTWFKKTGSDTYEGYYDLTDGLSILTNILSRRSELFCEIPSCNLNIGAE